MKILVVEDEQLLANALRLFLESRGFTVDTVYDGKSAVEYAGLGIYDLVILDIMLPGLDGYQVTRQLRAARNGVPILMLTARSDVADRIEGWTRAQTTICLNPSTRASCSRASMRCCAGRGSRWRRLPLATRCSIWRPAPCNAGSTWCV